MIRELQLRVLPQDAVSEQTLKQVVSQETGVSVGEINAVRILKRSIDARQRTIFVNLKVQVFIEEDPTAPAYQSVTYGDVSSGKPVYPCTKARKIEAGIPIATVTACTEGTGVAASNFPNASISG